MVYFAVAQQRIAMQFSRQNGRGHRSDRNFVEVRRPASF
jgi:hypothetical protein